MTSPELARVSTGTALRYSPGHGDWTTMGDATRWTRACWGRSRVRPPVARNGGRRSFGWGGSDVAPDVVSLRVRTGKMAEEMRTRERTRKGKESVAFAHGLGGEDASTAADVRDSGEQLCFSPAAILPKIRGERGRRWWGRTGCGWGSRLVS
jgi:hypothetical protein